MLITSGQPSLNPRMVKEADALTEEGYEVTVIYQYLNEWATLADEQLLREKKWTAVRVGGDPVDEKITYFLSRLNYKLGQIMVKLTGFRFHGAERALGRCTMALFRKAIAYKAAMYIGHNLAALPATVLAAKYHGAKCGFDAEDFHRNEMTNDPNDPNVKLKTYIEDKYLHQVDYLSTASPLISERYQSLYPNQKPITLLNVFPKQKIKETAKVLGPLKLFWFSQTIGLLRGLQTVIKALKLAEEGQVTLDILGHLKEDVKEELMQLISSQNFKDKSCIQFHEPIPPDELFEFATRFDIGLATEPGFSINNTIALSNKVLTYIQSGLALLVSDTEAQKKFIKDYPGMGLVYEKENAGQLAELLNLYIHQPELLKQHQESALRYAHDPLNWEHEKQKLLFIIKKTLNN